MKQRREWRKGGKKGRKKEGYKLPEKRRSGGKIKTKEGKAN